MVGISSREIKNRIRSMQSTRQITEAMELVSTAKLRRAQAQMLSFKPYYKALYAVIHSITAANRDFSSIYLTARPVKKTAWIVISGDRGLAGGFNNNVLKSAWEEIEGKNASVLTIGKKAYDFFHSRYQNPHSDRYANAENICFADCYSIAKLLCDQFMEQNFDEIRIAYTNFESLLSQTPDTIKLLPLPQQESVKRLQQTEILYEPDPGSVLDTIIPEYVAGILYGALCESRAAEQAARRKAMDSATKNANEMIDELLLQYNRTRQATITQQITEIMAGG